MTSPLSPALVDTPTVPAPASAAASEREPSAGTVVRMWRYPVKSMRGEQIHKAAVDARGLIGDRLWAVWDADGRFGSGKDTNRFRRMDGLLDFTTRLTGDPETSAEAAAELTTPDGEQYAVPSPEADAAVRKHLGRDDVYLNVEGEVMHHDAGALHLLSTATLDWYIGALEGLPTDERRLRPNLVLNLPGAEAFAEDAWVGRRLRIGSEAGGVVFDVFKRTERCVMTNAAQDDLPRSPRPLKAIAHRNLELGIYGRVVRGGRIRVGDSVVMVEG